MTLGQNPLPTNESNPLGSNFAYPTATSAPSLGTNPSEATSQGSSQAGSAESNAGLGSGGTASNFSPKQRRLPLRSIVGAIVLVLVLVGGAAGVYLTQINQDVRQQASVQLYCGSENQPACEDRDGSRYCNAGLRLSSDGTKCESSKTCGFGLTYENGNCYNRTGKVIDGYKLIGP